MYQVRFYLTERGNNPAVKFIAALDEHTQAKTAQIIQLLQELGPLIKRPFAAKVKGKIFEIRPRQVRRNQGEKS